MKKLRNNKIRKLLAFMVALALMVSCMPSAYTISASEAFGDGTEDIFTDGEITSEPAAEESTPDVSSADQEETEQAQQSTLTYENDSVKVTAEALEDGALPQNTALKADSVNENSSVSYDTVSQKLSAAATDKGSSLRGFFAYDVYFADGDGNRVEPNGRVRVTFEYKTPAAPELTDAASTSVTVEKLHYNSSTGDTDVNTLQANEDLKVLNVNEGKQIQTLQVETGNAAVFAVMWDSPEIADVEAEDVSGNEDEASIASEELTDGMDISDEPEQDAAETPAAENPEVTPDAQPEITRYDYKSDEVNVKVTLTDPADLPDNAELSVTPVELSQEAEDQITEEAIKEKKAIEKIHAYDIKFLVDGEEVQPGATVKVSVSLNDEKKIKDADVYHVDENDNVENMDGSVAKNGDVEFETTHFSTYVIVNNSPSRKVKVTLQHYCNNIKIYADTVRHIEVGGKIPDYRATENYNIEKVEVVKEGEGEKPQVLDKDKYEVRVASDTVVKIYYTPKQSTESGDVVFYDYQVSPGNGKKGINDISHYQKRDKNNMMIMGTQKQTGLENYNALGDNNKNANIYDENDKWRATTGLVTGLSNDYKEVVWKVDQPGFFTDAKLGEGKEKYTSYKLLFSKTGNNYKLTGVKQPGGANFNCNEDGSNFFPLENPIEDQIEGGRNYFGMRYDIEFKLGDYVGPLNYTFTGDDDLWVLLDGKKVVIDVGGIHKSIERSTDLWNDLGFQEGIGAPTDEEKNKTHRITVLYMERGAYESNCKMNFTIPDARFVNVENVPLADLTLTKVDSKGKGISGAKFKLVNENKLVNDNGGETYPITTSDDKGSVTFNNLKEGTYTLTETMAPNGYEASQESWIVKVTSSDDKKAVATLYKADGKTKIEKDPDSSYHIMNYTQEEIIESSMDYSKTATVKDWNKRTYDINITADSKVTSGTTITQKVEISGAEIKDVIDPRFVIVGDKGNPITNEMIKAAEDSGKPIQLGNGGILSVDSAGNQVVKWTDQTIPNIADGKWNKTITVKAKEEFIGGNSISTNVYPDSKITTGYGEAILPQPSVNVKLLSLDIGNDETTVFKGDQIDPTGYKDELAKTLKVKELDGTTTTITGVNPIDGESAAFPTLSSDQKDELLRNATITLGDKKSSDGKYPYEYIYPGTTDAVGYFTYTYKVSETPGENMKPHKTTTVGTAVEKYELVVTYHPYSQDERKNILSGTKVQQPDVEKGGTQVNSNLKATGNYVVNVVAGNIQIIKKLDGAAEKDETFNFTITDGNNQTVATATATIKKDDPTATATAVFELAKGVNAKLESDNTKLSELSRGDYKVVESLGTDVHYELQEIATDDRTNCYSAIAKNQQQKATDITFTMGTDTGNKEVLKNGNTDKINGQIGIAKFTNKKTVVNINLEKVDSQTADTKLSGAKFDLYKVNANGEKTDQAIHSYTSDQHGAISIENLPIGQYVLIETEAPTGYMVSAKPWNIVVENGRTVKVTYNGDDVTSREDNDTIYYQITNAKVYSLPESGGPGTYGFTISGVAILATALLLFINNKRREEEAKKS